ncbi:hypothetical protein E5676_scaffold287G00550 [Cucumis melo var. makuwa]|uniref:Uncharacterized protein n=1 Tax=Cucumis melo var. makuwa TaxID=1194695 RepID=A0A5D3C305_CUCMM|nr:hypothetical protein E5676_scaffold287G00550 [Cucumis melo var. makuwa]
MPISDNVSLSGHDLERLPKEEKTRGSSTSDLVLLHETSEGSSSRKNCMGVVLGGTSRMTVLGNSTVLHSAIVLLPAKPTYPNVESLVGESRRRLEDKLFVNISSLTPSVELLRTFQSSYFITFGPLPSLIHVATYATRNFATFGQLELLSLFTEAESFE